MRNVVIACIIALMCCGGCSGRGPTAYRVASDTDGDYYPRGDVHFVERGQRSKGVLVATTPGFNSPFEANWRTCLVPMLPTRLAGPVWTGGRGSGRGLAAAIWNLPRFRDARYVGRYGDSARIRFRQDAVWILGTDPFILGLPAGSPERTWREFAETATGVRDAARLSPLPSFVTRFVVDEELDQPLDRLVVFPSHFWTSTQGHSHDDGTAYVVKLSEPLTINDALAALAAGDPLRLGAVEQVALRERSDTDREAAGARLADRERLMRR